MKGARPCRLGVLAVSKHLAPRAGTGRGGDASCFSSLLCSDRGHQRLSAHNIHRSGEVVGQYV